jgi:hypothetical protein
MVRKWLVWFMRVSSAILGLVACFSLHHGVPEMAVGRVEQLLAHVGCSLPGANLLDTQVLTHALACCLITPPREYFCAATSTCACR